LARSYAPDDYLEAVYILESEGVAVIGARVAEFLSVTPPSVTEALQRLQKRGLTSLGEHHLIALTESGRNRAEALVRRHRIAERWLTDVLGLDWAQADVEASKLAQAFSLDVADRLSRLMDNPETCPHGNPIPGNNHQPLHSGPRLDDMAMGEEAVVERVVEHAEVDAKLLHYLWRLGILPGVRLKVTDKVPGAGTVVVLRNGEEIALGLEAASKIQVQPTYVGQAPSPASASYVAQAPPPANRGAGEITGGSR